MTTSLGPVVPAVGSLCTYAIGSDRYAGSVFGVFVHGREIWAEFPSLREVKHFTYRAEASRRAGMPVYRVKGSTTGRLYLGRAIEELDPNF